MNEPALDVDFPRLAAQVRADRIEDALPIFEMHARPRRGERDGALEFRFVAERFPQVSPVERGVYQLATAQIEIPDPDVRAAQC